MKKIMTLCFFAFAMILGTQTVAAQSKVEINSLAAKKTQALKKAVKFNNDTEDLVYQTYLSYEKKKYSIDKALTEGETISDEDRKKVDNILTDKFKSIFTAEEYRRYLAFEDSQK
ncbi:MAG: hypothetical protein R2783_06535 [Gelidibacter sp.]